VAKASTEKIPIVVFNLIVVLPGWVGFPACSPDAGAAFKKSFFSALGRLGFDESDGEALWILPRIAVLRALRAAELHCGRF
jgi:hypothetical protein